MLDETALSSLSASIRGALIEPGDPAYDAARALYNGMIDSRPRLVVRCTDAADVIGALGFARETGLAVAVRGAGHNGAGFGGVDDGIVIDLGAMRGVRVDPSARTVRVGAGCTQGDVDHATWAFGLAVPAGIISTTGIAGLTLGGGHGYLARRHGLTIDNLLEADVVLADGHFVTASPTSHPDLFWALRGGGGNFGVVTSFLFRAHPIGPVFAGPIAFDLAVAREVMRRYRACLPAMPESMSVFLGLKTVPSCDPFPADYRGRKTCLLMTCHDGPEDEARAALEPLLDGLPEPWFDWRGEMPYPAVQAMFDALMPAGLQWYWCGDFVRDLPDAAIETHLAEIGKAPTEMSLMHLYPIDGAVRRTAADATAWRCRDATWSMVIAGIDPDPAKAGAIRDWARSYWQAVHRFDMAGAYPNFLMAGEAAGRLAAIYGDNLPRLVEAKRRFDPGNMFQRNLNIPPELRV